MKTTIRKTLALLVMLAMVLTVLPLGAYAVAAEPTINQRASGSITVTKYADADAGAAKGTATGTQGDAAGINAAYEPLNGATFKLFKIADADAVMAYYNGTNDTQYLLERFNYDRDTKTATYQYDGTTETTLTVLATGTTAGSGTYKFSGLEVGIYALVEDTAPDQITVPLAENSLISIPMVNTASSSNGDNDNWMYDVYVYPKNHEATGSVELTKQDQAGNGLDGVTFELYKKAFQSDGTLPNEWTSVTKTVSDSGTETQLIFTTATVDGESGKLTLANLPAGLNGTQYKLVEVSAPDGFIVNQTPLYFKVNTDNTISWNAGTGETGDCNNTNTGVIGTPAAKADDSTTLTITLRNERPTLTKQVKENGEDAWKTDEQYQLTDTITYRLDIYVPNNVAELETFTITDTPDAGIDDDPTSVQVSFVNGNTTTTLASGDFTARQEQSTGKGKGFVLTFDEDVKDDIAGQTITVTYTAKLNAQAVIANIGNGNTVELTYSMQIDPARTNLPTYSITDEARVYTYQYQITKYKDSVADGNKLASGETVSFQLLNANKEPMKVIQVSEGVYRLALSGETGVEIMTTNAQSTLLIQGLSNGVYYLKETKTIAGYNLLSAPFKITVAVYEKTTWKADTGYTSTGRTVKDYQSTAYYTDEEMQSLFVAGNGDADPTATANSNVINKKGFVLPQTGSMGYLLFCAVGLVLIAGGTMLIFGGRKKKIR
ncbi:MAG: SpaH/EbpB family LPXTG-anchored major pilin [Faecousia sp.]